MTCSYLATVHVFLSGEHPPYHWSRVGDFAGRLRITGSSEEHYRIGERLLGVVFSRSRQTENGQVQTLARERSNVRNVAEALGHA